MIKKKSNATLLKGASLEKQNAFIQETLQKNGINDFSIRFEPEKLQEHINEQKTFGKGLIAYLGKLNRRLEKANIDSRVRLRILQILSEIGSLVFPNTSSCYALVPSDLKKIDWEALAKEHLKEFKKKHPSEYGVIEDIIVPFINCKLEKTVSCLVSLCLCAVLVQSLKENQNALLVDPQGKFSKNQDNLEHRPRIKAGKWIDKLSYDIKSHLIGFAEVLKHEEKPKKKYLLAEREHYQEKMGSSYRIRPQEAPFERYSRSLALVVTKWLLLSKLLVAYKTILTESFKNPNYYAWCGSNLLVFPKTLALPMVYEPNDWVINENKGADDGGFLLSSLTNVSYQGYLDSISHKSHNHHLCLKRITHINNLQKVKYTINTRVVNFYKTFKKELTDSEIVLLDNKWLQITTELYQSLVHKHTSRNSGFIAEAVDKDVVSLRNSTMKAQEALTIAEFYTDKTIYWPVFQDFRGRVYRIGNLNPQLDSFVRSMLAFQSDAPLIKRRKQSAKSWEQYNLLLKEVLVEKDLIEQWDAIFGDRGINNEKFDLLLLEDLLANKLSLIQVGQLLLIRQGAYDKVAVFYDASASAYQIMGVINVDKELCKLTNVLSEDGKKHDIYDIFLDKLKQKVDTVKIKHSVEGISTQLKEYLAEHIDRKLVKSIVMPLVYGKTANGFAKDLFTFFKKGNFYVKAKYLTPVAKDIIDLLKEDALFKKVNLFMKALKVIGGYLFEANNFIIKGYYSDCLISYNKLEEEQVNIYYNVKLKAFANKNLEYDMETDSKTHTFATRKIKLSRPMISEDGYFIKSKTKSTSAFVANYVHFLDGSICHYIIENMSGVLKIGTIHDSFMVNPSEAQNVREQYKKGLLFAHKLHVYNMFYWLHLISFNFKKKNVELDKFIKRLKALADENKAFETNREFNLKTIPQEEVIEGLKLIKKEIPQNDTDKIAHLINYFEAVKFTEIKSMEDALNSNCGELLFPDN